MKNIGRVISASVLIVAVAACSSDDNDSDPAAGSAAVMSTTTTLPPSTDVGLFWESVVDESRVNTAGMDQPTFETDGLAVRLQVVLFGEEMDTCQSKIDFIDKSGGMAYDNCLLTQWAYEFGDDYPIGDDDEVSVSVDFIVNPDGTRIDGRFIDQGYFNPSGFVLASMIPGGEPGAMLTLTAGSAAAGYTTYDYQIPTLDELKELDFSTS